MQFELDPEGTYSTRNCMNKTVLFYVIIMKVCAILAVSSMNKCCINLEQTLLNYMAIDVLDENLKCFEL